MMMDGDLYPELDRNSTSFPKGDPYYTGGGLKVVWDAGAVYQSPTGAWARKHVVGNADDNNAEGGGYIASQKTSLSTHLLRLADVYLIYTEAIMGNAVSTSDPEALKTYNAVRKRAVPIGYVDVATVTFDELFDERRRELAYEGDNWFDYVRLFYYKPTAAIDKLSAQNRGWYEGNAKANNAVLKSKYYTPTIGDFELPIPEVDLVKNANLSKEPVAFDFSKLGF
jgi:hypothetical protein